MKAMLILVLASGLTAQAQSFIDWCTLDAGGGLCTGGAYTLAGTLGQPDAAASSRGDYDLLGGFWSAFADAPTGAVPRLRIARSGTNVILAWPVDSSGFQLQASPGLTPSDWSGVKTVPVVVGDEYQVVEPLGVESRFYRLMKQ